MTIAGGGVGVAEGEATGVGVAVGEGDPVGVALGEAEGVGVGVDVGFGLGVGVGVGTGLGGKRLPSKRVPGLKADPPLPTASLWATKVPETSGERVND